MQHHSIGRTVLRLALLAAVAIVCRPAAAQTVWSGLAKSFTKPDFSSHLLPENRDVLNANVVLTRSNMGGLINFAVESSYSAASSPALTEWATDINNPGETILATNWANLNFTNWLDAYGGQLTQGALIPDRNAVVHLIADDIYLDLRFTSWTAGNGGGFSYLRSVPEPSSTVLLLLGSLCLGPIAAARVRTSAHRTQI